jgi:hypothetical protein
MPKTKSQNAAESKNQTTSGLIIDPRSLLETAKELTNKLNNISTSIQALEDGLREINANFPHQLVIETGEESIGKTPEDRHGDIGFTVIGYKAKTEWRLSWEEDEESKDGRFRLFFIEVEKEIVYYEVGYDEPEVRAHDLNESIKYRKPLRQTKIPVRLRAAKHLQKFVNSFSIALQRHLDTIQRDSSVLDGFPF